ncbi:hypothetical protein A4X03_0g6158 [Tilletia caries]|uniref:Muskelin N-terminal domain-containing protein n=1 Tax=Tilletia caries TaxID=13290 RepID=A0A8T8SZY7_9BASI|nr:hypothetical protein CF335_g6116 [Tilletia laevis]KAE8252456.1 hypothetical protein A4X03_0g6158 [Tilletia caries]
MRDFKIYAGPTRHASSMTRVLRDACRDDGKSQEFACKHTDDDDMPFVVRYVRIEPLSANGVHYNFSIWHVALLGISDPYVVSKVQQEYEMSAFRALLVSSNLGRPLRGKDDVPGGVKRLRNPPLIGRGTRPFEHPLLSRLFRALTRRERWDEVESILDLAAFAYAPDGSGAQLTELSEEEHLPPTSSGRRSSKQKAMEERFVPGRLHRAPGVDAIGVSAAATLAQVTSIRSRIKNLSRCSSSILTDQAPTFRLRQVSTVTTSSTHRVATCAQPGPHGSRTPNPIVDPPDDEDLDDSGDEWRPPVVAVSSSTSTSARPSTSTSAQPSSSSSARSSTTSNPTAAFTTATSATSASTTAAGSEIDALRRVAHIISPGLGHQSQMMAMTALLQDSHTSIHLDVERNELLRETALATADAIGDASRREEARRRINNVAVPVIPAFHRQPMDRTWGYTRHPFLSVAGITSFISWTARDSADVYSPGSATNRRGEPMERIHPHASALHTGFQAAYGEGEPSHVPVGSSPARIPPKEKRATAKGKDKAKGGASKGKEGKGEGKARAEEEEIGTDINDEEEEGDDEEQFSDN